MKLIGEIRDEPGVYCIENTINKKVYIGSSKNLETRLKDGHLSRLKGGYHNNSHLQKAFDKYGEENFICFALEYCIDESVALKLEQKYLDTLLYAQEYVKTKGKDNRFKELGYNLSPVANGWNGHIPNDEQRKKMSETRKALWQNPDFIAKQNKVRTKEWNDNRVARAIEAKQNDPTYKQRVGRAIADSEEHKKLRKPIICYNRLTGEFIKEYESIQSATIELKLDKARIQKVLRGETKYTNDMVFKYKEDDNYPRQIQPVHQYDDPDGRKIAMDNIHKKNCMPIGSYLNGRLVKQYVSSVDAERQLRTRGFPSASSANIRGCANGITQSAYGFQWKYLK